MKLCPTCKRCYEDVNNFCVYDQSSLISSRPGGLIIADRYRLDRLIGRGGMGAVYAGTHVELDRPAAIKLLLPESVTDPQAIERFRREARAAARLNHPNVADVYDYGTLPDGGAYIIMEQVNGQTLREYMDTVGRLAFAEAVLIARQVADGVEAAHRGGIVHRDLKPSNIILAQDHHDRFEAKVVDFGIAKLREQTLIGGGALTLAGSLMGTPRYMSPEQCAGHDLDVRSDIYSLGVILYEMLAGRPPFDAPTATAIALKHIQEPPPPLRDLRADVPDALAQLVMQALNKNPAARPQTAAEFARQLRFVEYLIAQPPTTARPEAVGDDKSVPRAADHQPSPPSAISHSTNPLSSFSTTPIAAPTATVVHTSGEEQQTKRTNVPTLQGVTAMADSHSGDAASADELTHAPAAERESAPLSSSPPKQVVIEADAAKRPLTPMANISESAPASSGSSASWVAHAALFVVLAVVAGALTWWFIAERTSSERLTAGTASAPSAQSTEAPRSVQTASPAATANNSSASRNRDASSRDAAVADARRGLSPPSVTARDTTAVPAETRPNDARSSSNGSVPAAEPSRNHLPEAERLALRNALGDWISSTNARDVERQMAFYAPTLQRFYRSSGVGQNTVRAEKSRFSRSNSVEMSTTEPHIEISSDGRTARMRFDKRYVIERNGRSQSGRVLQELRWERTPQGWKIISERDLVKY